MELTMEVRLGYGLPSFFFRQKQGEGVVSREAGPLDPKAVSRGVYECESHLQNIYIMNI